jgi:hypothetical protein
MAKPVLSAAKWLLLCAVAIAGFTWLYLYLDSIHQCHKAEHLLSDLTALSTSADFAEVRDLSFRYGGSAVPTNHEPVRNVCTPEDCAFEIEIMPAPSRYLREEEWLRPAIGLAENSLGLRPWLVSVTLTVKNGTLRHSSTRIYQERMSRLGDYSGPIVIRYKVEVDRTATVYSESGNPGSDYVVIRPHVTGPPTEVLDAIAVQTSSGKWKRAFDVHLGCLTSISQGCIDFRQLAPTAWADYEAKRSSM